MSAAELYPYNGGQVTIKEICALKYPVANVTTVRKLLASGMTVAEVIAHDISKATILSQRKARAHSGW